MIFQSIILFLQWWKLNLRTSHILVKYCTTKPHPSPVDYFKTCLLKFYPLDDLFSMKFKYLKISNINLHAIYLLFIFMCEFIWTIHMHHTQAKDKVSSKSTSSLLTWKENMRILSLLCTWHLLILLQEQKSQNHYILRILFCIILALMFIYFFSQLVGSLNWRDLHRKQYYQDYFYI